ncbi:postreplication repair E3 ubiquitin-protein ligase rad18 [Nannizzia gypsea CBS 118893]|uniref:Postreplication repair E3 ubiquitin-protein ligase RAD18 n=1 Tax=Arthroderma gypseum (strain ATCC MYA-4604 / CBS 118893) TaxID=535722 RepID=E4V443_ARTGP|nr:postreplication repair E3 ubiquitin-protein ligase rad18 [Nannizzia gypsea CBS 118893]EFR04767.1 postreplication repair E3 ubiquitin-protein ligase rad18 [Nannizzia gypsea CBS 118893]
MDRNFDIPDSTDWTATPLPEVARFESALRCQICKDFFDNPVITSCCHTFCSLCIRRCLSSEGKCPVCRSSDQELKLRRNWAVRELVESFKAARPSMLAFVRNNAVHTTLVSRPGQEDVVESPATKRRKINHSGGDTAMALDTDRRTRSQARRLEHSIRLDHEPVIIPDSADEEEEAEKEEEEYQPDDGLVACPVCMRRMKNETVFSHLDNCTGTPEKGNIAKSNGTISFQGSRNSLSTSKTLTRLPAINYAIFKDTSLRKKLKELGIPDWGPKLILQKRHTEWMNLWNANCDSLNPKSKRDLLRDLDVWERTQGGLATSQALSRANSAIMKKDFDVTAWSESHDDDYRKLIAEARSMRAKRAAVPDTTEDGQSNEHANETPLSAPAPAPAPTPSTETNTTTNNPVPEMPSELKEIDAEQGHAEIEPDSTDKSMQVAVAAP